MARAPGRVVFVVGAGASSEVDLPIGTGLVERIEGALNLKYDHGYRGGGAPTIAQAMELLASREPTEAGGAHPLNKYVNSAWRIRDAMSQALSIDNFIDSHRDDRYIAIVGKLAIVSTILHAERGSSLYVDPRGSNPLDFKRIKRTWYARLFERITENCRAQDIAERLANITFVVFNYDRCIEHFLYSALQNYYKLTPQEAAEALKSLEILHPYGTVGELPWQKASSHSIDFGMQPSHLQLNSLAEGIRTFTEGMGDRTGELTQIRARVDKAARLAFLGFAYHDLNMRLLLQDLDGELNRLSTEVFGSSYGMSDSDVETIVEDLRAAKFDPPKLFFKAAKCADFYAEFGRSLSLV